MTKRDKSAKIMAIIALVAIVVSIFSTGFLVIYESFFASPNAETTLTQEQLDQFLKSMSGSTATGVTATWVTSSGTSMNELLNSWATLSPSIWPTLPVAE